MTFLNEYEKLRLIGKGAFAAVYKVRHIDLGYIRAIKVSNEIIDDENDKAYQTFLKECRVLLKIGNGCHPNIVRIYQPRLIDTHATVEMDYVDGETLNEYLQEKKFLPVDEVLRFATEVTGALAYCHVDLYKFLMDPVKDKLEPDPEDGRKYIISAQKERELIAKYGTTHNDLHSNNIMRRHYDGGFVLLDFGLAIQNGQSVKSSSRGDGAVEYRPPEKWEDKDVSFTSDVYSLGILLYEALAGRVPFPLQLDKYSREQSIHIVYMHHLNDAPPPVEPLRKSAFESVNPGSEYVKDYPEWLEAVIMKCLEKRPEDRYANAKEVITDINTNLHRDRENLDAELKRLKAENEKLRSGHHNDGNADDGTPDNGSEVLLNVMIDECGASASHCMKLRRAYDKISSLMSQLDRYKNG